MENFGYYEGTKGIQKVRKIAMEFKGAIFKADGLNSLRWLIGRELFFIIIHKYKYF